MLLALDERRGFGADGSERVHVAGFELLLNEFKDFEYVSLGKVVIDDVDEEISVVDVHDGAVRGRFSRVSRGPSSAPKGEGFLFPDEEGGRVDDGGLADLATGEDTPSDGNGAISIRVADVVLVDSLVVDTGAKAVENADEDLEEFRGGEEFNISLLVDDTASATPADSGVSRVSTIDARLRVDGPEARFVEANEAVLDGASFEVELGIDPRQSINFTIQESDESATAVRRGDDFLSPKGAAFGRLESLLMEEQVIVGEFSKGRRS